jgi:hypothetical protein
VIFSKGETMNNNSRIRFAIESSSKSGQITVQCQPTPEQFCSEHAGRSYNKLRAAMIAINFGDCYPEVDEDGCLTGNLIPGDEPGYSICDIDASGSVHRDEYAYDAMIAD